MRFLFCLFLLSGLGGPVWSAQPETAQRRLVLSAPDARDPAYREQAAVLLPVWAGLVERDFVIETRFGAPAFSVVLIGKDGGEKLRRQAPLAPAELFAIVDAMPMRREEMRSRPAAKP